MISKSKTILLLLAIQSLLDVAHPYQPSVPKVPHSTIATQKATHIPHVIQGGMGIRISKWSLAREVSKVGELGVVSGTAMDTVLVRELQDGDIDGSMRRALASFPDQDMVQRILKKYYIEGGKGEANAYKSIPMWTIDPPQHLLELCVVANYCEVWLAKHNDDGSPTHGLVGMNLLTKVQLPTIPSLYGAMLADVDYVIMGAGIPMKIPGILDNLAESKDVVQQIDTADRVDGVTLQFSPHSFWETAGNAEHAEALKRPKFLPIVSSVVLAQSLLKRANGKGPTNGVDGFVVELSTAGGHNAPPRGFKYDAVTKTHSADLNERGEPVYGEKDDVNLDKFAKATKGLPFWVAGSYADPKLLCDVLDAGGAGVQVGTAFALCKESGMKSDTKQTVLTSLASGKTLDVYTDPEASPTGFPFKVLQMEGTLSDLDVYQNRPRTCNLGYLRDIYQKPDGTMGYRCASEPIDDYIKKGGERAATQGRKCLCNALCTDTGFAQLQRKSNLKEPALVTIGDDVKNYSRFLKENEYGEWEYSATDVVDYLLSEYKVRMDASTEASIPGLLYP